MAFGWIGSTIAFGAGVRHRRGVGRRYRRTFAHLAFRQISRLAGVARFSQRNFVRSALTSPLTNPKCSKRSTIELVLLERTSVIIGVPPSFNFDRVTCAVPLTLTTDNGQQESVRPGGGAGPSQLRSKFDLAGESAAGAKRPFIRKQHPVTDQLESGSGRGRLTVPSGEPRHQCFGGICEHRERSTQLFSSRPSRTPP
jgi:hypothetical protein